jgi:hypothetical protein
MGEIRQFHVEGDKRPALTDDTRLWRYVPLKTLFAYLSGNVFIPSIETLRRQDPFEGEHYIGLFSSAFGDAIRSRYGADRGNALVEYLSKSFRMRPMKRPGK